MRGLNELIAHMANRDVDTLSELAETSYIELVR